MKLRLFILSLTLLTTLTALAHAEEMPKHIITVNGSGQVTAKPDALNLTVGVQTIGKTVEAARRDNAAKMQVILQQVKGLQIAHMTLQTSGFSVYPMMDNKDNKPLKQYQASNTLNVKIENENSDLLATDASRILDTAMNAGANDTSGPNFYLSQNNKAQQEALKLAITQAKQTAAVAAEASGVKLIGIYSIETFQQSNALRAPRMVAAMADDSAAEPATPVEAGELEVNSTVTMKFEFAN